jgi:hypothetical protein
MASPDLIAPAILALSVAGGGSAADVAAPTLGIGAPKRGLLRDDAAPLTEEPGKADQECASHGPS